MKNKRLIELKNIGINIPNFFLYEDKLCELDKFKSEKLILRSSYRLEDWDKKSFAWFFSSIWWIHKNNIKEINKNIDNIKKDAYKKIEKIAWRKSDFGIIIQEYIESDFWWVIFVEWNKILIEISSWKWAEKVVVWETEETIYIYKDYRLKSWKEILNVSSIKSMVKPIFS